MYVYVQGDTQHASSRTFQAGIEYRNLYRLPKTCIFNLAVVRHIDLILLCKSMEG